MKIRSGFVSNSSSSSFIIGVGVVKDLKAVEEFNKGAGWDRIYVTTVNNLKELNRHWDTVFKGDIVTLESFTSASVDLCVAGFDPEALVATVDFTSGDDSDFWDGDSYDYDITKSFFNGTGGEKILDLFDSGAISGTYGIGAGRNG